MTALDSRAASYEKLQLLMPALRDAKTMIETKPKLSKVNLAFLILSVFIAETSCRATFELAKSCSCRGRRTSLYRSMPEVSQKSLLEATKIVKYVRSQGLFLFVS